MFCKFLLELSILKIVCPLSLPYLTILSLVGTPNIRGTPLILGVSPLISGVSPLILGVTPLILGVTPNKNFGFWSKKLLGKLKKIFFNYILNTDFQQNFS